MVIYLALGLCLPVFSQPYAITDLNKPSDSYRLAYGINAAGEVVGEYGNIHGAPLHAFWYRNGTSTDLGVLAEYMNAYAYGINDSGQIVGWCDRFSGVERAFLYADGVMTNLGTLDNLAVEGYSEAYTINRAGQIVGTATGTNTSINHAVLWSGATKEDLGSLGGPTYNSRALGINNSGVIVGESEVIDSIFVHAFVYSNNIMTDLGTLPGGAYSRANAINDAGVIVGEADTLVGAGFQVRAFVCRQGPGSMEDLGTLGGRESSAYGINSAGHIVGYALDSNDVSRAFLYDGTKMWDLNELIPPTAGWTNLEAAVGINDAGQIAGYGQFADGVYHAFLLTRAGPLRVTITDAAFSAGGFNFSFGTEAGRFYEGQFTTALSPGNTWQTFTNLAGNGSAVRVTDTAATNSERYYRVVAQ